MTQKEECDCNLELEAEGEKNSNGLSLVWHIYQVSEEEQFSGQFSSKC